MKFYIEDFGCSLNKAETRIIAQQLVRKGWIESELNKADYVIVNTCGVKEPTENKIVRRLKEIERLKKGKLIVYGCLVDINYERLKEFEERGAVLIGVKPLELFSELGLEYQGIEAGFLENPYVAVIPINQGCLGNCSFCATKKARGGLRSYSPSNLRSAFRSALLKRKEIWITSPDSGAYGKDIGTDLGELLKNFLKEEGDFRIRIGMMNPDNYRDIEKKMFKIFEDNRVFRFLHLPVQSGSSRILEKMNRRYSAEEYEEQVFRLREFDSKFCLASDYIVGFPSESFLEFKKSLNQIKRTQPDIVNVSRFYPRPETLASLEKDMISREKKERSREMSSLCREISAERNKMHIGKQKILIDEDGSEDKKKGRNNYYKVVLVEGKKGEFVEKEVLKAENFYLE